MSEKRFTSGFGFNKDYDNPIRFITDEKNGKDYVLFAEITDLLNALNDENEQLRKSVLYWQKKYEEGTETLEIGEQQSTIERFERWNDYSCKVKDNQEDTFLNWEDVVNKLDELSEENKYLKKRIKVISDELYCKDRKLEELGVPIECCDKR